MNMSPSSEVVIWDWIWPALAYVTFISQPVADLKLSAISWNGFVMPAPQ